MVKIIYLLDTVADLVKKSKQDVTCIVWRYETMLVESEQEEN